MSYVYYEIGCRNCLSTDGIKHVIEIRANQEVFFSARPEFELVKFIEDFRKANNFVDSNYIYCNSCGSDNIEVYDPEINDKKVYDLDFLSFRTAIRGGDLIMFSFKKILGTISLKPGGFSVIKQDSYKVAFNVIKDLVMHLPDYYFIEQIKGDTFVCIVIEPGYENLESKSQIEKFYSYGLTRKDIIETLQKYYSENLHLMTETISFNEKTDLIIDRFKGSLFNTFFSGKIGYASYNYDDKISIISKCASNETVRQFIEKNKDNYFIIDKSVPQFEHHGKVIFTAKKID